MTLRMPVVDIPLDDSKFRRFYELFEEYDERLGRTPGVWQKVDRSFRQTTAAMLAQNQALREFSSADKLRGTERLWHSIASASRSTLGNVLGISRAILKWGTLIGGGLLGGSLFGIDRMASDMAASRYAYMGLGMRYGSWRSFGINMSRFVDPGAFLSSINQAVSNPALQGPLYALGVNPNGSTEQVSLSMLRAMRRLALNTPRGELGLMSQAYGLGPFGGLETLMRLRSMSAGEFYRQLEHERRDKNELGLPPGVARKWQDFTTQMERAKSTIFKTFVVGLAPLEKPLERLSGAFSGFLSKVMSGPEIKKGIDELAKWLDTFSVQMASKKFQNAVTTLVSDTGTIAQALHWFAKEIRLYEGLKHPGRELAHAWHGATRTMYPTLVTPHGPAHWISRPGEFTTAANKLDAMFGFPAGTMRRLIKTESSFNPSALGPNVPGQGRAMGLAQLMPATARQYGLVGSAAFDPYANMSAAANYLASLVRHYHGNMSEALAAYNLGPSKFDTRYGGRLSAAPRSVRAYVSAISPDSSIVVTARHKTGGNPVLSAAGLAGVPQ